MLFRSGIDYAITFSNENLRRGFESGGGMLSGPCGRRHDQGRLTFPYRDFSKYGGWFPDDTP
jgi:hypothetical protein